MNTNASANQLTPISALDGKHRERPYLLAGLLLLQSLSVLAAPVVETQLTDYQPSSGVNIYAQGIFSPNGEHYCFIAHQTGLHDLWCSDTRQPAIAQRAHNLFQSTDIIDFAFSSDSNWLYFPMDNALYRTSLSDNIATRMSADPALTDIFGAWRLLESQNLLVYLARVDGDYGLFSVSLDAPGQATRVTGEPLVDNDLIGDFEFSPDGQNIVFIASFDTPDDELYSVALTGGNQQRLNFDLPVTEDVTEFIISPNSNRVVYEALGRIFSVPIQGGPSVELNSPIFNNGNIDEFLIASDSGAVIYLGDENNDGQYDLKTVPIDGSSPPLVLDTVNDFFPPSLDYPFEFSADGTRIIYMTFLSALNNQTVRSVLAEGLVFPVEMPGSQLTPGYTYIPSIDRVVYRTSSSQTNSLLSVKLDGTGQTTLYLGAKSTQPEMLAYSETTQRFVYQIDDDPDNSTIPYNQLHSVAADGTGAIALTSGLDDPFSDGVLKGFTASNNMTAGGDAWVTVEGRTIFNILTNTTTKSQSLKRIDIATGATIQMGTTSYVVGEPVSSISLFDLSPTNSHTLAYWADKTVSGRSEIYLSQVQDQLFSDGFE